MEKTLFRKIGIDQNEWSNFERETYSLIQKDGQLECGILCATKQSCGGFIHFEDTGSFTLNKEKKSFLLEQVSRSNRNMVINFA